MGAVDSVLAVPGVAKRGSPATRMRIVGRGQPALDDDRRGHRVERRGIAAFLAAFGAVGGEALRGLDRTRALVHQHHRQRDSARAVRARRHARAADRLVAAVERHRIADDEAVGPPFLRAGGRSPASPGRAHARRSPPARVRHAECAADRDADPARADIEAEHGAVELHGGVGHGVGQAWPL